MVKIVGYWTAPKPELVEEFEQHYASTHIKLAEKLPHLRALTAARLERGFAGGDASHYRIVELTFDSEAALEASMASPEWAAMGQDAEHIIETYGAINSGDFTSKPEIYL